MRTTVIVFVLLLQAGLCFTAAGAPVVHRHPAKTVVAAPVIASLTPNKVSLTQVPGGDPQPTRTTLTVHGAGFRPGACVLWDGRQRETQFVSSSELVVVLDWRLLAPVPREAGPRTTSRVHVVVRNRTGKPSRPVTCLVILGMTAG